MNNYDCTSENLLYLKSQVFIALDNYEQALLILDALKNNFPSSDYLEIIKFDLEKSKKYCEEKVRKQKEDY